MRLARRAGSQTAKRATPLRKTGTVMNTIGSQASTPNRNVAMKRVRPKAAAIPIGERLIREEAVLDRLFTSGSVTPVSLAAATRAIGATQAELRNAHLAYHLSTVAILTPEQVRRYGELRGYAGVQPHHGNH